MRFLLDTDICSAHLKGNAAVTNRCLQYTGGLAISAVTLAELYTWALRTKAPANRLQDLSLFLNDLTVLVVDEPVARRFGEVQAQLLDGGRPAPGLDLLIASTALVHNLTLVSHNTQDFHGVPGLGIADWLSP